jgi:hypothetical protein
LVEISFQRLLALQPKDEKEITRDKQYEAFRMRPMSPLARVPLYISSPFSLLRFFIGWSAAVTNGFFLAALEAIHDSKKPFSAFEKFLINWSTKLTAHVVLSCANLFSLTISRPKVDYNEYLGDEWELTYDSPGCIVSNHSGWMDIVVHMTRQPPCHVAKEATLKIPGVGRVAKAVGCLFVRRSDKNQKNDLMQQINLR